MRRLKLQILLFFDQNIFKKEARRVWGLDVKFNE